jgi:hypothetical protein
MLSMAKKDLAKDQNDRQEGLREAIRKLDLGNGIEVTMGLRTEDGTIRTDYYFTNKLKGLKKTTKTTLGDLVVEYSSSQAGDNDLLHFLSQKVR